MPDTLSRCPQCGKCKRSFTLFRGVRICSACVVAAVKALSVVPAPAGEVKHGE